MTKTFQSLLGKASRAFSGTSSSKPEALFLRVPFERRIRSMDLDGLHESIGGDGGERQRIISNYGLAVAECGKRALAKDEKSAVFSDKHNFYNLEESFEEKACGRLVLARRKSDCKQVGVAFVAKIPSYEKYHLTVCEVNDLAQEEDLTAEIVARMLKINLEHEVDLTKMEKLRNSKMRTSCVGGYKTELKALVGGEEEEHRQIFSLSGDVNEEFPTSALISAIDKRLLGVSKPSSAIKPNQAYENMLFLNSFRRR